MFNFNCLNLQRKRIMIIFLSWLGDQSVERASLHGAGKSVKNMDGYHILGSLEENFSLTPSSKYSYNSVYDNYCRSCVNLIFLI
jgi:hypothetical protein